jgi:TldD protein
VSEAVELAAPRSTSLKKRQSVDAIDVDFRALPLLDIAGGALEAASAGGASRASVRVHRVRRSELRLRDGRLASNEETTSNGVAVQVVLDGTCGFAADGDLAPATAAAVAGAALETARLSRPLAAEPYELAEEPVHRDAVWGSSYEIDPFAVDDAEKAALLADWSRRLLAAASVDHVYAKLVAVRESVFYADSAGTSTLQQRVRLYPQLLAASSWAGRAETMRTLGPPSGRGWEYVHGDGWDWESELAAIPDLLAEKARAAPVEPGTYDLVLDPTNLWLTLHETVGHATELDRVLGSEAGFAGTSFPGSERLGELRYGSRAMNATGDRTTEHGLATVGYDDEGVAAQKWDIVRDGVLVGYQLDRATARCLGAPRSNGCAYADSAAHVPMLRMANVSLEPAPGGPSTEELVSEVECGIYVVGDDSFSIDTRRLDFQFTGQRFYRIRRGRLAGQLRGVAYRSSTPAFWRSLAAVGGPETYLLMGADYCGKGQPGQIAAASHGCPAALFRDVRVLDTGREA